MTHIQFVRLKDIWGGYQWFNIAQIKVLNVHEADSDKTDVWVGADNDDFWVVDHPMDEVVQIIRDGVKAASK